MELSWEHKRYTVLWEQDPVYCGQDGVLLRKQNVILKTHCAQVVDMATEAKKLQHFPSLLSGLSPGYVLAGLL